MGRIYHGYGGGTPLFTSDGRHLYEGYGGGTPLVTIEGNRIYAAYGGGVPLVTVEADRIYQGTVVAHLWLQSSATKSSIVTVVVSRY